jgi:hypothetical protein
LAADDKRSPDGWQQTTDCHGFVATFGPYANSVVCLSVGCAGVRACSELTGLRCLAALSAVSFAIGACSSDLSSTVLRTPDWASFAGAAQTPGAADAAPGAPATAALVPGGVALQMTECDVVRRAGTPEKVDLGADERGDRAVVLTYTRGPLPGVYRFSAGRLFAIERAPEAPPTGKPQKPATTAKKPPAS